MHTHSDVQLLAHPDHACKVHQGVTLEVLGQDGLALAPVDDATMALLRAQLAGWNGAEPELDDSWRSVAEYLDSLRRHDGGQRLLPAPPRHAAPADRGRRRPRPPRPASSTRCARSCVRDSPRARSACRPDSPTRPGMYASDDELVALCRRADAAAPTTARTTATTALHAHRGLRRLDRDRAPRGRAAAPRARAPRLRLQPRARAASCSR